MNLDHVLAACRSGCPTSASPTAARRSPPSAGCPGIEPARRRAASRSASRCRCTPPRTRCAREIMPVNDRYPLAEVLDACRALLRPRKRAGVHRVRDARGRQRPLRPGRAAGRSCSTRASSRSTSSRTTRPARRTRAPRASAIDAFRAVLEEHGAARDGAPDARAATSPRRAASGGCGRLASVRVDLPHEPVGGTGPVPRAPRAAPDVGPGRRARRGSGR